MFDVEADTGHGFSGESYDAELRAELGAVRDVGGAELSGLGRHDCKVRPGARPREIGQERGIRNIWQAGVQRKLEGGPRGAA